MKEKKIEKKNLIGTIIFLIIIVVILLGGALLYNKFFYSKTYSEVEEIMVNAAQDYLNSNKDRLPKNINDVLTITDESLVKNGNMEELNSYLRDAGTCTGEVNVTNINGDYRYAAYLDCGKNYQTKSFIDYIEENVEVVSNTDGLNKLNDELVYRGDNVDNYLRLGGKIYRIVKFVDEHPVIILTDEANKVQWDNRYNVITDKNTGINDYEKSRIKDYLNDLYEETGENRLLTKKSRLLVVQHDLPIGKRCNDDTDKTGKLEGAKILSDQYIGLLTVSDYLNASLDENCTGKLDDASKSCANYNYLNKYKYTWWTVTANSKNTFRAYTINVDEDIVTTASASDYAYARPVLYLANDAIYVSGNGTKDKPYIVK